MKVSKRSQRVIDAFDEAARSWGWQSDQGFGAAVRHSQAAYEETKLTLEQRIARLEKQVAKLKDRETALEALLSVPQDAGA